ncbi:hypothetical protein JAO76_10775 [Pontibacter sp. BT310]|uniref:HTH luxR-type domain-containing protein n=1 Tax=Pontibacter populi TaxID=890055 RepID=A0ABS6XC05_9BACT|nr:two-component regulator propeller domain-containing protein [Pontibacter populi]MBJ6118679.1 hypothetical protein [Pontibacter sp. BT310]MBR0571108.1 hypothetical protein [Microvirga sp. STS03]MBW3365533.1 hypothetical protein [Pontibacter populi]
MRKHTLLLILILFSFLSVSTQVKGEGIPYIRNFTLKEYQASPQNWAVVQDHRGLMYFGNNYGVLEFDGNHWRQIGMPNRSNVHALAISKAGRVYVGGQNDFGYLTPDAKGLMTFVSLKNLIEDKHRSFADVWSIYTIDDNVYFCTVAGVYHYRNGKINVYNAPVEPTGFPFLVHGKLLIPVPDKGIYELKENKLVFIPGSEKTAPYTIASILPYPGGKALVITEENGILIYDEYTGFQASDWVINDFLIRNKVNTATVLSEGYAIGTTLNGLLIIDSEGNARQHINRERGLQNSTVRSIYQDQKGNLWLALNNGIDYVESNSPFTLYDTRSGLPGTAYTSLLDKDLLYLGTSDGLFFKTLRDQESPLNPMQLKRIENTEGQVYKLQKINDKLLLSHHNGPFEIVGNKAVKLSNHRGAWMFMQLKTHPGYVICGTYHGLLLYKFENGKLLFQRKLKGFDESSRVMEEDADGTIWVAHGYKGLYKLKLDENLQQVENVSFYNQKHGFPSDININVFKINGKLIFTGLRGIYSYNKSTDRFELYPELNNLFDSTTQVRKLYEDKEGNIWFSAGNEMGYIRKHSNGKNEIVKNVFNRLNGKLVGGFEHIAYYNNQNVLIGIDEGFVHYRPTFLHRNGLDEKFYTLIRKVEAGVQSTDSLIYGGTTLPDDAKSEAVEPALAYTLNSVKFTFGAIVYDGTENVQYQYYLDGFDQDWSPWVTTLQKEYTNLREGTYTFKVRAKNIYNQESVEANYTFSVLPPWYRSWWAFVLYALTGIVVLLLLRKVIQKHIRSTEAKLQQVQEKALKLKEAQHMEEVLKAEKEIIRLNNEKLERELNHKTQELTSSALHVMQNMEAVYKVKGQLEQAMDKVADKETRQQLKRILRSVDEEIKIENNWEQFEFHFNQVHQDFLKRLSHDYPDLTHKDLKMCAYLRLNLSSKEIASLLKLSLRGVETSRYRIRKKMNLDQEASLTESILRY